MRVPPTRFRSDLWRRLSEAQEARDASGFDQRSMREIGAAVAAQLELGSVGGRRRLVGRAAVVVVVAAMALAIVIRLAPFGFSGHRAGPMLLTWSDAHDVTKGAFVTDARSDLPLQFSDGSTVTFRAGSTGRMQRFTRAGAEIVLERGRLDAHIVHAETTLWLMHAGPYRVQVTGTRFAMIWSAATFEVELYEGAVIIDGAMLGAGVPLRAGNRLRIASSSVLIEPLVPEAALHTTAAPASVEEASRLGGPGGSVAGSLAGMVVDVSTDDDNRAPVSPDSASGHGSRPQAQRGEGAAAPRTTSQDDWLVLAERGSYREALSAAKRLGWDALCHRLDARRLLTLGDVARFAGARARARQAFEALVARFPDDRLAPDALFSLGRLAFEGRRPAEATRWFGRYVADWPEAPLGDQAVGRLLECAIRVDDRRAAMEAARRYLARAPNGPHAIMAREVLEQPVDGPP